MDKPQFARSESLKYYKKALSSYMPDKGKAWDPISETGNPTKSTPVKELIKAIQRQEPKTTTSKPAKITKAAKKARRNPNDGSDYAELSNQMDLLRHQNEKLTKQVESLTATVSGYFRTVHSLLRTNRNATSNENPPPAAVYPLDVPGVPVVPGQATATATTNNGNAAIPYEATLSPNPRTLDLLWQEYQFGIGGRRPAKSFSATERGRVKHMYHRRKVVWDVLANLVRAGMTAQQAIDKIYSVYGADKSNGSLINCMRVDRKTGGHPELLRVEENNTRPVTTPRTENPPPPVEEPILEVPAVALIAQSPPTTTTKKGKIPYETTLSSNPRTLAILWLEYQFGIGGRKPARTFTPTERGRVKYMYHRRKVVWDVLASLVGAGMTAQQACEKIYAVYGLVSVAAITNKMRQDRKTGGHPELNVDHIIIEAPPLATEAATLSAHPRDLYILWQEYQVGIGDAKAAKDFSATERGRVRYLYTRRKLVWEAIANQVRAGCTAQQAIKKIYSVYGEGETVTYIVNQMRQDRQQGGHPKLQI
jgi:hypothetical protein